MFCVVFEQSDNYIAYGPYKTKDEADALADKLNDIETSYDEWYAKEVQNPTKMHDWLIAYGGGKKNKTRNFVEADKMFNADGTHLLMFWFATGTGAPLYSDNDVDIIGPFNTCDDARKWFSMSDYFTHAHSDHDYIDEIWTFIEMQKFITPTLHYLDELISYVESNNCKPAKFR
jgi:hypothetical protein